jgi:hypothetical protein
VIVYYDYFQGMDDLILQSQQPAQARFRKIPLVVDRDEHTQAEGCYRSFLKLQI